MLNISLLGSRYILLNYIPLTERLQESQRGLKQISALRRLPARYIEHPARQLADSNVQRAVTQLGYVCSALSTVRPAGPCVSLAHRLCSSLIPFSSRLLKIYQAFVGFRACDTKWISIYSFIHISALHVAVSLRYTVSSRLIWCRSKIRMDQYQSRYAIKLYVDDFQY